MKAKLLFATILAATAFVAYADEASSANFTITIPQGAEIQLGMKKAHFVDFSAVEPIFTNENENEIEVGYELTSGKVYNYRTWMKGGLTNAGHFTYQADASKCPVISFSKEDYFIASPSLCNHDTSENKGYETGDIFLNINEKGFMSLEVGDTFMVHAMRSWELTDNVINNYFIEPDFHYAVLGLDGEQCDNVITIKQAPGSAWAELEAVGQGTAIVLVSYDAIKLNYFSGTTKKDYLGGEIWGAIWPENTGVFVVSVGYEPSQIEPQFTINELFNAETKKLAGESVDAEHDVFYFLDSEDGFPYSFKADNAKSVKVAYPVFNQNGVSYTNFSGEGIIETNEGYTVLLKEGRQIVQITDESGNACYQVLTAKKCALEITNLTQPESNVYNPGDKLKLQFKGLRHPANKLAGIYNMSATLFYGEYPEGTMLKYGSNQYMFGSNEAAQAITATIPESFEDAEDKTFTLNQGMIQVKGFGDPIGNHRNTDYVVGRTPNFNAVSHDTYFGSLPSISLTVTPKNSESGLSAAHTENAEPLYYINQSGTKSTTPWEGFNIIIYTDGTARKALNCAK